jgi:hypothetical protein
MTSTHSSNNAGNWSTGSYASSGWSARSTSPAALRKSVEPLVKKAALYDKRRLALEQGGGTPDDLRKIVEALQRPVVVGTAYGPHELVISKQDSVKRLLYDVGGYDLHWQVRRLGNAMPAFYLCRVRGDYWAEYRLVVEDLFCSHGYPVEDARFVRLMSRGHETWHLCLSPYRRAARDVLDACGERSDDFDVDRLLFRVGRHVLQAAWHEDQRIGVNVAGAFDIPWFHSAIELLYLCLSGDLCQLRTEVDEPMMRFFESAYEQHAIRGFLGQLEFRSGADLNEIPQLAESLYRQLASSFGAFLNVRTRFGSEHVEGPLYKVIFGNIDRLGLVADQLADQDEVTEAAATLDSDSRAVIATILDYDGGIS